MQFKRSLVIAACSTLAISACGGSPTTVSSSPPTVPTVAQSATDSATATATPDAPEVTTAGVEEFLEAIQKISDPAAIREALSLTKPGSPVEVYVNHLANSAEAALDGGLTMTDSTVEKIDDSSFKSCDSVNREVCVTFSDIEVDSEGLYVNLRVDDQPIQDRLTAGDGTSVTAADASFTFLTAYKSIQSGALFVSVKVETSAQAVSPFLYSATYRSPDGKQRTATDALGPVDIGADSNSIVTMIFQGVDGGGQITLDGCVDECASNFDVVLQVG